MYYALAAVKVDIIISRNLFIIVDDLMIIVSNIPWKKIKISWPSRLNSKQKKTR